MMEGKNEGIGQDVQGGMSFPWEWAKDKIYPCLAPRKWMNIKSQSIVYRRFINLYVYYYIRIGSGDDVRAIWIDKADLDKWGIRKGTLDAQAMKNLKRDGYMIENDEEITGNSCAPVLYMMTNRICIYGAAGLLDKEMIAGFAAQKGTDLYIIPSSVNEIIFMPVTGKENERALNAMIEDINEVAVTPEERLADYVYHYERKTGRIRIVCHGRVQRGGEER